jgi:hypothetical protein
VYRLQKAIARNSEGRSPHHREEHNKENGGKDSDGAYGGSLLVATLESASDSVLPLAEAAAEEAGRWVAQHSPAVIRDRLLPRFIDAFKAAA